MLLLTPMSKVRSISIPMMIRYRKQQITLRIIITTQVHMVQIQLQLVVIQKRVCACITQTVQLTM